jgi:hypothetical protein
LSRYREETQFIVRRGLTGWRFASDPIDPINMTSTAALCMLASYMWNEWDEGIVGQNPTELWGRFEGTSGPSTQTLQGVEVTNASSTV